MMFFLTGSHSSLAVGIIILVLGSGTPLAADEMARADTSSSQEPQGSTGTEIPSCINLHSSEFRIQPSSFRQTFTHGQFRSIVFWAKKNLEKDYNERHISYLCRTHENTLFVRFEPLTQVGKSRAVIFNLDKLPAKDAGTELFIAPNITGEIVLDKSNEVVPVIWTGWRLN